MQVITGAITSIDRGNRLEGRGSDEQVDLGDNKIKYLISLTVAGWNNENVGGGLSGILNGFKSTNGSFERRALISSKKKDLNWLADRVGGGFDEDELKGWQTLLIERHRDF